MVLVAHGSRDPRAAAATAALARAVRRARPGWAVRAAYLDHAGPRPLDVLASLRGRPGGRGAAAADAAYHGRVDIPAAVASAAHLPRTVVLADVLGPLPVADVGPAAPRAVPPRPASAGVPWLRRIAAPAAGLDAVVLAAAGTRDAAARATVEEAADGSERTSEPSRARWPMPRPPRRPPGTLCGR